MWSASWESCEQPIVQKVYVNKLAKDKKPVIIVCPMQDLKAYDTEEGPDVDRASDKTVETQVKRVI